MERGRSFSGRGDPPARFAWFELPKLIADRDRTLPGWIVEWRADDELWIENERSGERVHLFVDP